MSDDSVGSPRPAENAASAPISPDGLYWWDGTTWRPTGAVPPPSPVAQQQRGGLTMGQVFAAIVLALAVVIGGLWVVGEMVTANDGVECATRNADRSLGNDDSPYEACP